MCQSPFATVAQCTVDEFLVSPSANTRGVVEETEMGGIGSSIRHHIIHHVLFHFIPGDMRQIENFCDLVFGMRIIVASTTGCSTVKAGKSVLGFFKGSRLWPMSFSPDVVRIRKCDHGVGHKI